MWGPGAGTGQQGVSWDRCSPPPLPSCRRAQPPPSLPPSLSPSPSTVLAALATLAAAARTGAATGVPDPFPSLRSVGDTLHTTLAGLTQNKSEGVSPALAGLKEGASEASHKVSAYIHGAKNPFGDLTMEAWHKLDDEAWAAYNKTGGGKCDPATRPQFAGTVGTFKGLLEAPLSFAFSGSGTLLPFHEGVIQGLQDRGVLTDEVMREAAFGGVSGGAITAVLTALGMPGQEQYTLFLGIATGIAICQSRYPDPLDKKLNCTLQSVGLPVLAKVLQTKYPDAVKIINGRVNVWACQVRREGKRARVFSFLFFLLLLPFLAFVFFTSPHLHLHRPPIHSSTPWAPPSPTVCPRAPTNSNPSTTSCPPWAPPRTSPAAPSTVFTPPSGAAPTWTAATAPTWRRRAPRRRTRPSV